MRMNSLEYSAADLVKWFGAGCLKANILYFIGGLAMQVGFYIAALGGVSGDRETDRVVWCIDNELLTNEKRLKE